MTERSHPFGGELHPLKSEHDFDVHKLETPNRTTELPDGSEKDFDTPQYAVTEYFSNGERKHEEFVKLKNLYEAAKTELGEYLPTTFFVEGEPTQKWLGKSFYVVQKFDNPTFNQSAKELQELNSTEFSADFLNKLLLAQERLVAFLERHAEEIPRGWVDQGAIDPQTFKENILYSPQTGEIKMGNIFRLGAATAKQAIESEAAFEPSDDRFKVLKMLGLAGLAEKIDWAIEKSAAPEWIRGKGVHWRMDNGKLEKEGKRAMALTFDDGPNDQTEVLLDILKEENVKATFFLVGSQIAGREAIVKRIVAEGHDIGVHEWGQEGAPIGDLKQYSKRFVGPRKDLGEVKRTKELITQVSGVEPVLGRVAGVHGTVDSLREFQAMGLDVIHGNPYDVLFIPPNEGIDAKTLLKRAMSSNGQGRIRIFHIGAIKDGGDPLLRSEIDFLEGKHYPPEETLKMIRPYIEQSKKQGYQFVKVGDYIKK